MSLEVLKTELWKKAKGNGEIAKANHHYEDAEQVDLRKSKRPHSSRPPGFLAYYRAAIAH